MALGSAGAACKSGDDDDSGNGMSSGTGGSGSSGMGGGSGGSGAMCGGEAPAGECVNDGMDNLTCPEIIPLTGSCAEKGDCCHRASNAKKEAALCEDDDMLVLEYRVQYSNTLNHPKSIGLKSLANLTTTRFEQEQQSQLWRYELPRSGGKEVSGMGKLTIGVGRYNCDGTYSYYGPNAAPAVSGFNEDKGRWQPVVSPIMVDVSKDGRERSKIAFADNKNRELTYTVFLDTATFKYDWELINQGFDITTIDTSEAGRDCQGKRTANKLWETHKTYVVYTPLDANDVSPITPLGGQTYAQLVAFGPFMTDPKVTGSDAVTRCPAGDQCQWVKLPDSLCPIDDAERALFGCHLGAMGNPNAEEGYPADADLKCTPDKPTSVQDPDSGGMAGQCCDALGTSQDLPACNSYRLIQSYVAAAAEITTEPSDEIQRKCCDTDDKCQPFQMCSKNQCEPKSCSAAADCGDPMGMAECREGKCELPIAAVMSK
jgi:hypothetical protein